MVTQSLNKINKTSTQQTKSRATSARRARQSTQKIVCSKLKKSQRKVKKRPKHNTITTRKKRRTHIHTIAHIHCWHLESHTFFCNKIEEKPYQNCTKWAIEVNRNSKRFFPSKNGTQTYTQTYVVSFKQSNRMRHYFPICCWFKCSW